MFPVFRANRKQRFILLILLNTISLSFNIYALHSVCAWMWMGYCQLVSILIKKKTKFSSYIRIFGWDRVQSRTYMRKVFLIYEEMRKFFPIYEEADSNIWLCIRSLLISLCERKILFSFLSVFITNCDACHVNRKKLRELSCLLGNLDWIGC